MTLFQTLFNSHGHSHVEDALAIVVGTAVIALGLVLLSMGGAITGGTAGLALFVHYLSDWPFSWLFILINLPFFALSILRMGWAFTGKTVVAICMVSFFTELHPRMLQLSHVDPLYGAILAGLLIGLGLIILFRHKASLGGINILALYLQEHFNIRAGLVQLVLDLAILVASCFIVSWPVLIASVIGAIVLNLSIAMNHRKDRYVV